MSLLAALRIVVLSGAVVALAACQDDSARAEDHYQSALAFLEEGDTVRADVEFRNVFQADGDHLEARQRYAQMLRETGDLEHAYRQYLRLVEQDPSLISARIALAEMALEQQNWEEVRWHGQRVLEMDPEAPGAPVIALNIDYINALEAEDEATRREIAARATTLFEDDPDNPLLRRLVIDTLLRDGDFDAAIGIVDTALANTPEARNLHDTRLQILAEFGEQEPLEAQLRTMLELFPEDDQLPGMLLRFYVARDDIAGAQTLLTDLAGSAEDAVAREEALTALVRLRLQREGPDAAIEELDRIIAADPDAAAPFRALHAVLRYEGGDIEGGIAGIETLLEGELTQIERGRFQIILAQMLLQNGNLVGAQRLVDTALEADPGQTDALKMRAAWLIEDDDPDQAIQDLRSVLDDNAEDAAALTLMAQAYARAGDHELSRDFLSLAMQASGGAPAETIRYAAVLLEDERYLIAEEVLIAALRLTPNEPELLRALGRVYLQLSDWLRAGDVERTLRALDTEPTRAMADSLRAAILVGRGQVDQALEMLEAAADDGNSGVGAQAAVVQARLATGDLDGALGYVEDLVAETPGDMDYRQLLAMTYVAVGRMAEAEEELRVVTTTEPQRQQAWIDLIRVQDALDREEDARQTLVAARAAHPEAPDLMWVEASYLERAGDIDGAIGMYEQLYEMVPNSPVVANNLASLITTYRSDETSLDRAYTIARRLRGTDVPPFADTYGWIAYRRGELGVALEHLERAAEGLPEDALVQYHLGMTYLALDRPEDALAQLSRAVELAGPGDTRPQIIAAQDEIATLQAAGVGSETTQDE
ncbi:tetratricopeptide repeat protein [Gymnodinialimonas ulvae]|uniref:tetratricopeptide repeat protein n=1 Tax=Gymnodinialimonas ulvae TaxID=3126504 RepID=UPI00309B7662